MFKIGDVVRLIDVSLVDRTDFGMSESEYFHLLDLENTMVEIVSVAAHHYFDIKSLVDGRTFYAISEAHFN